MQAPPPFLGEGVGGRGSSFFLALLAINLGCLLMNVLHLTSFWFLWVSPAVLLLHALHARKEQKQGAPPASHPRSPETVAVPA